MLSIKSWYLRYAKFPLVAVVVAIGFLQFSYLLTLMWQNHTQYIETTKSLVQMTSLALVQKNRMALESIVFNVSKNPNFSDFYLCEYNRTLLAYPAFSNGCMDGHIKKYDHFAIPGFVGYEILTAAPLLSLPKGTTLVALITIGLSLISVLVLSKIARTFRENILAPILSDFQVEAPLTINEFENLKQRRAQIIELEKGKALASLARQVAHDIRSPLSLLNVLVAKQKSSGVSEESCSVFSSATNRILKIADDLLERHRENVASCDYEELIKITHQIVQEKTLVFGAHIDFLPLEVVPLDKIKIDSSDWGRVISVLVDNALESGGDKRVPIKLKFTRHEDSIVFTCKDSGKGMTPKVLTLVKSLGGSFKKNGNGLGLRFLNDIVIKAEGSWSIDSTKNQGTTVTVTLPINGPCEHA